MVVKNTTGKSMRKYSNCLKESRFFLDLGLVILYIFSAYTRSVTIVLLSSSGAVQLVAWGGASVQDDGG
ncbi:MAG: hypothetical protein HW412_1588 [Bacteroidetes bacterium]|nr:hypothetical protein [Bacteroidota bacterium]